MDFTAHFLNNLLPILNDNILSIKDVFTFYFPDQTDPITILRRYIDYIPFPHELTLHEDENGNVQLKQEDLSIKTIAKCTSRMSDAFAAGKRARERIVNKLKMIYGNIKEETINKAINNTAHTALHLDPRDIGLGGVPLMTKPYHQSGMKILGMDKRTLQFVTIMSYKIYDNDALFGLTRKDIKSCFTLKCPCFDNDKEEADSIRIVTYGMDFSDTYHGNIVYNNELPEDGSALRITTYATNHSATWNEWFKKNSKESKDILRRMIGKIEK